jgi:hypothetical protein
MTGRPESGGTSPPQPTPVYRLVHVDTLPTLLRRRPRRACSVER